MIFDQSKGIPGIDVSHYQALIDYNAVKAAGARFVYIKATDGDSSHDPAFSAHVLACGEAGL